MLHALISIAGILLTIFFVIGTHEAAHFIAARCAGVKVLCFSIGFGKTLLSWRDKQGAEYVLALVPLGGYVRMLDENEGSVSPEELHRAYNRQPFYKKFLIVLAGPLCNLFCAFCLYWLVFVAGFVTVKPVIGSVSLHSIAAEAGLKPKQEIVGIDQKETRTWTSVLFRLLEHLGDKNSLHMTVYDPTDNQKYERSLDLTTWKMDDLTPDPFLSLGIVPYEPEIPLVIGVMSKDSPAAMSSLRIGDKIIAINKKKVSSWIDIVKITQTHPETTLLITVKRNSRLLQIPVKTSYQRDILMRKTGYLGIGPLVQYPKALLQKIQYGPLAAIPEAWTQMMDFAYFNLVFFGKMITGKLSLHSLGGPITIFDSAGNALNYGWLPFISFLAFLSISIGVINLLPIPGLDGGHMLIQIIEAIIRRPLPEKLLLLLYRAGFCIIIFILIQALINDILRLF